MKAMIFAAGLGTRLRPLTNDRPKALVEVEGKTLLERVTKRLISFGFDEILVNVHHFADLVETFLAENHHFGIRMAISDERELLLNTGGGLKNAAWFFEVSEPFLVHNTDILTDLDLGDLYQSHLSSGALATLAVRNRATSRYLLWDEELQLCGWKNISTGEVKMARPETQNTSQLAFSGIHVLHPSIFPLMSGEGAFSIIDTYLELAKNHPIKGYQHDHTRWMDLGKIPQLEEAAMLIREGHFSDSH